MNFKSTSNQKKTYTQFKLGVMYERGQGVTQNYQKAIEYYTKAANQGCNDALFSLGGVYYTGKGVPQNYQKAIEYYTKAVNQDSNNNQTN